MGAWLSQLLKRSEEIVETEPLTFEAADEPKNRMAPLHISQFVDENFTYEEGYEPAIFPCVGFNVELGSELNLNEIHVKYENRGHYKLHYKENFFENEHLNLVGGSDTEPVIISVMFDHEQSCAKVLIRTRKRDYYQLIEDITIDYKAKILNHLYGYMPDLSRARLKEVKDQSICKELLHMEDRLLRRRFKFGVIYCKEGQTLDDEMFSNEHGSPEFEEFLDFLGERIQLKGWDGYDGELDTHTDTTGTHSVFTHIEGMPTMFHVSTLLPYSDYNTQQIERKRHIGNDVVCIVFQDGRTPFSPLNITSKFNHVYIVVQLYRRSKNGNKYRVAVASKRGVAPYGPLLPQKPIFKLDNQFKHFLFCKLINAERSAYAAPGFGLYRTRKDWLKDLVQKYGASPLT